MPSSSSGAAALTLEASAGSIATPKEFDLRPDRLTINPRVAPFRSAFGSRELSHMGRKPLKRSTRCSPRSFTTCHASRNRDRGLVASGTKRLVEGHTPGEEGVDWTPSQTRKRGRVAPMPVKIHSTDTRQARQKGTIKLCGMREARRPSYLVYVSRVTPSRSAISSIG